MKNHKITLLLLLFLLVNPVCATNNLNCSDNNYYYNLSLQITNNSNFLSDYLKNINLLSVDKVNIDNNNIKELNNSNTVSINKSVDPKLNINKFSVINFTNVYHNTSDLINNTNGKNNKSNELFNNTSYNHSLFNNTLKSVKLNKDNFVKYKELNIFKVK